MTKEELNDYFDALSKERSDFMQKWFETQDKSELDEYISHLTREEQDALFIFLIMKFKSEVKE